MASGTDAIQRGSPEPVRILGAGPAGLTAAITLAKAGRAVEVHERKPDVGSRFSGDLHGVENWSEAGDWSDELAAMKVEPGFECDPCHALELSNGRRTETLRFDEPLFYLVRRGADPGCLDHGLREQALAAGARIHFGSRLAETDADVVATGPIPGETFVIEKGWLFETDAADLSAALVDEEAAPRGYAYLLVKRGRGCLCSVLFDEFDSAQHRLDLSLRAFESLFDFEMHDPRPIGGVASSSVRTCFAREGRLRAGEAAGIQDFVWGFGIRNVMLSGHLAARSLLEGDDYEALARRRFAHKQRVGVVNRMLWERLAEPAFRPLAGGLRLHPDPNGLLRQTHRAGTSHRLLYPLAARIMRRRYPRLRW